MAYDEELAQRVRDRLVDDHPDLLVEEKRMFGGLAFLVGGHLAVAASGQGGLLVRCDPGATDALLGAGVRRMEMRGREVDGWLRVDPDAVADDEGLARWVTYGTSSARGLAPR